jgi:hypothetical protein
MGCKKAQGFLETHAYAEPAEILDASKNKRGRDAALQLAKSVRTVVIARGKKIVTFDMKSAPPDDDTLASLLLGPTGNLKAPTLRLGQTLLVGFGEPAYQQILGAK